MVSETRAIDALIGLGQVRYILKSVANGDDQSAVATKAVEIIDEAAALLKQYEEALELANHAINAAFGQAEAEYQGHDKRAAKYDAIVMRGQAAIRAALKAGQS